MEQSEVIKAMTQVRERFYLDGASFSLVDAAFGLSSLAREANCNEEIRDSAWAIYEDIHNAYTGRFVEWFPLMNTISLCKLQKDGHVKSYWRHYRDLQLTEVTWRPLSKSLTEDVSSDGS